MSPHLKAARARRLHMIVKQLTPATLAAIPVALLASWAGFWLAAAIARAIAIGNGA